MRDSVKANLIVFFIIAVVAFGLSNAFASLIIQEDTDSYKMIPIENDSFEPNYIYEVPTILPTAENTTTNTSDNNQQQTTQQHKDNKRDEDDNNDCSCACFNSTSGCYSKRDA